MADPILFITATDHLGGEFKVSKMQYQCELSHCYCLTLTIEAENFDAKQTLGQKMSVNYGRKNGDSQYLDGYMVSCQQLLWHSDGLNKYQLTLCPWLKLLSFTNQFSVFQQQSTKDILKQVFDNAGFSNKFAFKGLGSAASREYCVQYDESDYCFVTRLLSQEGWCFHFEHSQTDHQLIIQDANSDFDFGKPKDFDFLDAASGNNPTIHHWQCEYDFHAKSLSLLNYDYQHSQKHKTDKSSSHSIANNHKLTHKRFPEASISGDMKDLAGNLINRRLGLMEQNHNSYCFTCEHDGFDVGKCFTMASHNQDNQQQDYLVTYVSKIFTPGNGGGFVATTEAKAVAKDIPCYPELIAKPKMLGLQSAIVAASEKGEINQDDQGRVRILFQWDEQDPKDKTSCYVRVMQPAFGQFIPLGHQEVLVSFIAGDPDKPVIIGSVYNSQNPPPFAEDTQSGFSSKSNNGTNILCFDNKNDEETLTVSSAKILNLESKEDCNVSVGGILNQDISDDMLTKVKGNYERVVEKNILIEGKEIKLEGQDNISLVVGNSSIKITSSEITLNANTINIEAINELTLSSTNFENKANAKHKTSASLLEISSTGPASFKGMTVEIDAQTSLTAQSQLATELKSSLKTTVSAAAMCEIKGLIVKVN